MDQRERSSDAEPRIPDAIGRKRLIGSLLVKEGLITKAQLQDALQVQAEMASYQPIGQILVDQNLVTRQQLDSVLERYRKKHRLGDLLVEANVITQAQLEVALEHRRKTDLRLGDVVLQMNLVTENQMRGALANQLDIAFVDLDGRSLDPALARLISEGYARRHRVIPIRKTQDRVTVAMDDPADLEVLEDLRGSIGSRIDVVTTTRASFDRALARIYRQGGPAREPAPERQLEDLRRAHSRLRDEHEAQAQSLAKLSAEREAVVRERQESARAMGELAAIFRIGRGGENIMEVNADDLRAVVDTARRMVADWERFVASIETLTRENEERQASLERLMSAHRDLQLEHESLREAREPLSQELQAANRTLADLREAHDALIREHESATRALGELRKRYHALQQDRQFAADQLEAVLRRIKL